jgi:hypothetical protein
MPMTTQVAPLRIAGVHPSAWSALAPKATAAIPEAAIGPMALFMPRKGSPCPASNVADRVVRSASRRQAILPVPQSETGIARLIAA